MAKKENWRIVLERNSLSQRKYLKKHAILAYAERKNEKRDLFK
jgi:hypothetical protein